MAEVEDKRTTPVLTEENLQTALEVEFNDALRLGNLDSAAKLLADYKAQNGETAVYFYRQALLNERSGKLKEAYDALKKLYFENPVFMLGRNDFVRVSMLNIREPLSDLKEEIKRYQAEYYKQLDQKREDAVKFKIDVSTVPESTPSEFWKNNTTICNSTIKKLEAILELEPDDVDTLNTLFAIFNDLASKEKAEFYNKRAKEALEKHRELIAARSLSVLSQATKHEANQKFEMAVDVVDLGLETDPTNVDLLIFKAEVLQKLGCLKDALICVAGILKYNEHNSQAHRLKKALEAQILDDNLNVGIELLRKAEKEGPGTPAQVSKVRSAYSLLIEVIGTDPENLAALAGLYRCNIRLNEPLKAQRVLEKIREIDENFDPYSIFRDQKANSNSGDPCFVATRVYGQSHPNTVFLRMFRDTILRNYFSGRVFITLYHNIGPTLARLPEGSPILSLCRSFIAKLVRFLKLIFNTGSKC